MTTVNDLHHKDPEVLRDEAVNHLTHASNRLSVLLNKHRSILDDPKAIVEIRTELRVMREHVGSLELEVAELLLSGS